MNKWTLHSILSILIMAFSVATAPLAWADDSDSDELGIDGFDVVDDSDSEEGTFLELSDSDDSDSDGLDSDSDSEDSDSDDSDGDLDDSDSEDDSDVDPVE